MEEYDMAYEVGRLIAQSGAILVCGGKGGVMEAACKGAVDANGLTIGILPSDNIQEANEYVLVPVATGMGIARNIIIVRTAQAVISINGRYGTLSEMAFTAQLDKPLFSLQPWLELPDAIIVDSPEEAVKMALASID
jgi:uncharacterized protein (TIGR00725 family)